jgi:hypothetical protein
MKSVTFEHQGSCSMRAAAHPITLHDEVVTHA